MVHHSKRRVVVTDHSKLGGVAKWLLCPASDVDSIITDAAASDEMIAPLQKLGIEVTRV
jgi:DeoR/GlpR family transcriptional regulator of sugar metabolism